MKTIWFYRTPQDVPENKRHMVGLGGNVRLEAMLGAFKEDPDPNAEIFLNRAYIIGWRNKEITTENTQVRFLPDVSAWAPDEIHNGRNRLTWVEPKTNPLTEPPMTDSPLPWFTNGIETPIARGATIYFKPFGLGDVAVIPSGKDALRIVSCVNACGSINATNDALDGQILLEMVRLLQECEREFRGLPHSLGYDFTHTPKIRELLDRLGFKGTDNV